MANWWNDIDEMAIDEMVNWWNSKLLKWQIDEMILMKWQIDEMTSWENGKLMKCKVDEM